MIDLRRRFTRRLLFNGLAASCASLAAVGFYTWQIEPHWLEVVRRDLPIRHLPSRWAGATLAQLSDLHIGPRVDDTYLLSVFHRIRELKPDIVVYTGDWVSDGPDLDAHAVRILHEIVRGTQATFGILGNHDYGQRWSDYRYADRIASLVQHAGVRMLRNESVEIDGLWIAGLDDLWAGRFVPSAALPQIPQAAAAIVLSHNPDTVDCDGWDNYRGWILSGHTHGGQCKPPFLPPPMLPVVNRRYTCGEFSLAGDRHLYISRGVGHLLQVRFNVRPEVTLFKLMKSEENA